MELGAAGRGARRVSRPAEIGQDRAWIEDAAPRRLGPVALDETNDADFVEVGVGRGRGVEQPDAVTTGARREGLRIDPAADAAGQLHDVQRLIVVPGVRVAQRLQRRQDGRARAQVPARPGGVVRRTPLERVQEAEQRIDLRRRTSAPS